MSRLTILMILGILVAVSPYLGLPLTTLAVLLPILGLSMTAIGFTLRARAARQIVHEPANLSYETREA